MRKPTKTIGAECYAFAAVGLALAANQISGNSRPHLCPLPQERIFTSHTLRPIAHQFDQSSRLSFSRRGNRFPLSSGERASVKPNPRTLDVGRSMLDVGCSPFPIGHPPPSTLQHRFPICVHLCPSVVENASFRANHRKKTARMKGFSFWERLVIVLAWVH